MTEKNRTFNEDWMYLYQRHDFLWPPQQEAFARLKEDYEKLQKECGAWHQLANRYAASVWAGVLEEGDMTLHEIINEHFLEEMKK